MALNEAQLSVLRKARYDEARLEVAFPEALSNEEWKLAILERQKVLKGKSKAPLVDQGVAWMEEDMLRSERRRRRPLNHFATGAIPILMVNKSGGWWPDPRLWFLAHRQLGLDSPQLLPCGSITSEQLVKEFKDKVLSSIQFAKPFVEPLLLPESVLRDYLENPPSEEMSEKFRLAVKSAPRPKYPQRHQSAETLLYECESILEELEAYLDRFKQHKRSRQPVGCHLLANWCHLLSRVFEAGKAHAYLERDKDPGALAETQKGAQMVGKQPSSGRELMEESFEAFLLEHKRPPKIKELRAQLGAQKVPDENPSKPSNWEFVGHSMPVSRFKNAFRAIERKFKKVRQ